MDAALRATILLTLRSASRIVRGGSATLLRTSYDLRIVSYTQEEKCDVIVRCSNELERRV